MENFSYYFKGLTGLVFAGNYGGTEASQQLDWGRSQRMQRLCWGA